MTHLSSQPRGSIFLVGLVFFGIFFTLTTALLSQSVTYTKVVRSSLAEAQALSLAEAGIDAAASRLNEGGGYSGETDTPLGPGTFSVSVRDLSGDVKEITATGYVPDSENPAATKTVKVRMNNASNGAAFNFGVLAGAGGFSLSGGSRVNGSVYSNGSIEAITGVSITGKATAANPPALAVDQANDSPDPIPYCTESTCIDFGKDSGREDIAQSFVVGSANRANSLQFYMKKTGSPSSITVRIVPDDDGAPADTTLMVASISASAVGTSFSWVSVPLPATPVLDPSQTYWAVLDAGRNASRYYTLGANAGGYAPGSAAAGSFGRSWSSTSPSGLDGYFRLYLGGGTSMIGGNSYTTGAYLGTSVADEAWAHTIKGATMSGPAYCQESSSTNKPCDTSRADPAPAAMPVLDATIQAWKDEAAAGGTLPGDYSVGWEGGLLSARKIDGDLSVSGGGVLTLAGPLWVTGDVRLSGGSKVVLASSYGSRNGVIVADGTVSISGGSSADGSGQEGSYLFFVSQSACPAAAGCNGKPAISLSGGAGAVGLVAQNGTASVNGGTSVKTIAAKEVEMTGGATLSYDDRLQTSSFSGSSGPAWSIVPGTYSVIE